MKKLLNEHWHGTVSGATNYRCHCKECRDANAFSARRYNRAMAILRERHREEFKEILRAVKAGEMQ